MDDPGKFFSLTEYNVFTWSVGLLILAECAIMCFTSRGNKKSKEIKDRGTVWLIILGWSFSLMAGAFFRSQSVPAFMRDWLFPHFFYYMGIAFIICGIAIRCNAVWTLKRAFTLTVQTASDQHLITTGLYRIVRNPAYAGSMLSLIGVSFAYRHILGIGSVFILCLVCYGVRISIEEKALKNRFQDEFSQYCIQVKYKLIPGIY